MANDIQGRALAGRLGRVGVWSGALNHVPAQRAQSVAERLEDLGYGALWISEGFASKEAFTHAGLLLATTQRLVVATGVANIWARDATAAGAAAHTLGEAYPDRFVLGLGASHGPEVDVRGHRYTKPLTAMRDYLAALDAAGYESPCAPRPPHRILGALRPGMMALARDHASGAHPYFVTPEHTHKAREILGDGPLLAPEQAVLLETDPGTARAVARRHYLAQTITRPNYINHLAELGYGEDDLLGGGSDRLVDALVAWGDHDAIRRRVREHFDAGADHVAIQPITSAAHDLGLDQLDELAPALLRDSQATSTPRQKAT
ncbi:TIGR03620 family F420-dependent LLM class oxidoreductase [Nocardia suismassiliense]|uniref:TIGR03620 family F420-dependent LLM class oxidoreductase n=1 Tax=Nocardia suismassiliense TaxID=2077092 RepID=A0ABW6QRM3_9NOCA